MSSPGFFDRLGGRPFSGLPLGLPELFVRICQNKLTKIHMPKMKFDEDTEIHIFEKEQLQQLDEYFTGTNLELAYLLGRYCGLRINECFGLT